MNRLGIIVRCAALLAVAAILGGCAFGRTIAYSNTHADMSVHGDRSIELAVHDQRKDVLQDGKSPTYVGVMRSLYGIPYNVKTRDGKPLSEVMADVISRSLTDHGFSVTVMSAEVSDSRTAVAKRLTGSGKDRGVLLTLRDYQTDTYSSTSLEYNVRLQVFDKAGAQIADRSWRGDENIGHMAPDQALSRKLEDWFSDPKIVEALE